MTIEYIPLDSFGGFEAEQTLRLAGIEVVILCREKDIQNFYIQIVIRRPSHNILADFLYILAAEEYNNNIDLYGLNNTAYGDINNLKRRIDELLSIDVTGSGLSPIKSGAAQPVPKRVNEIASRILLYGLKRLILGKGWSDLEFV